MASVAGKNCQVRVAGTPTTMTDEATTTSDDTIYTITDAVKRVWSPTGAIVVEEAGTPVNAALDPYTLDRLRGRVIFASADAGRGAITVSGNYVPTAVAAKTRAFSYQLSRAMLDDTSFDDAGWMTRVGGLLDASGTLGRRWTADPYFQEALLAADVVVLAFYTNPAAVPDLLCWAIIPKSALQAAVDGLVEEDVEWQGTTDADNRVASVA